MVKRIFSGVMWFIAVGWGVNLLSLVTGTTQILGIALGAAVGTFVGMDPLHLIWPVRAEAPVALALDTAAVTGAMQTQV
jgi:hypothetical protein